MQLLIEVLVEQKGLLLFTRRGEEAALDGERREVVGTERRALTLGDAMLPSPQRRTAETAEECKCEESLVASL